MGIIGTSIKPFTAQSYKAGKFVEVSDTDVKGKWGVFFFYPADFTFVCPTELEDLADQYTDLQAMGVEVYSVSTDTHFSHKAWHDSSPAIGKINYHMLGDQNHVISNNFGVLREGQGQLSLSIQTASFRSWKSPVKVLAVTRLNWSARSRQPFTCVSIQAKSALRSGKKAARRLLLRSTSSARFKPNTGCRVFGAATTFSMFEETHTRLRAARSCMLERGSPHA